MGVKGGAGSLRHRITVQVKTETNELGSITETWADEFEAWAAFEPLGSREFPAAEKRHAESTVRFRIRYRHGIDPARHRILITLDPNVSPSDVRIYDIFPPMLVDGKRAELHIEAREVV